MMIKRVVWLSVLMVTPGLCQGQDDAAVDQAIQAIESAGGRVSQISAASEELEAAFHLSDQEITDQSIAPLGKIASLRWLNLANTGITDAGLQQIAKLPLTRLHLEKTGIGDAGLAHLKEMKELEYLNLYGTKVSDAGLEHLVGLKKLKRLFVWQSGVTESGMEKLKQSLPNLQVIGQVDMKAVVQEEPPAADTKTEAGQESKGKEADGKETDGKETDGKEADGKEADGKEADGSKVDEGDREQQPGDTDQKSSRRKKDQ